MSNSCYQNGNEWKSIRSSQICPICNSKKGRCSVLLDSNSKPILYRCKYAISNKESGDGWFLHYVKDFNKNDYKCTFVVDDYKVEPISEELQNIKNRVYRKTRELFYKYNGFYLYEHHKADLKARGLSDDSIKRMGYFSIPKEEIVNVDGYNIKLKNAIINELLKCFSPNDIIRVPGFSKITAKGKDFITIKNTYYNSNSKSFEWMDAYFVPYYDYEHRLVGMQYRLSHPILDEKGKLLRYFWYSTKGTTCSSPIDYYIPSSIKNNDVMLLTEGATKGKVSGEILGLRTLSEAGVGNYRNMIAELQKIEEKEKKKFKILLALDMDKTTNNDVLKSEISTLSLCLSLGYNTTVLEWNESEGKGLDDKLLNSVEGLRFISI